VNDKIGPRSAYLCGNEIAIADYLGTKALARWSKVNQAFAGWVESLKQVI